MYHIELLPSSSAHLTPGWTYVADRGYNSAQTAAPVLGRKRGIRDPGGRGDLSSKENSAIARHLGELNRENYREVHIPVKQKEGAGRGVCVLSPGVWSDCDGCRLTRYRFSREGNDERETNLTIAEGFSVSFE